MTSPADIYRATATLKSSNQYVSLICTHFKIAKPSQRLELIKCFAGRNSISFLPQLHLGIEKVWFKGTAYWKDRLGNLRLKYDHTVARYKVSLDEKRNYWAFVLSGVTIATFPFSVMTSYFGMNFQNMTYRGAILTNDYLAGFPGYEVIWLLTAVVYGAMILFALHYEIFYGVS